MFKTLHRFANRLITTWLSAGPAGAPRFYLLW
jgi:hypothetical protein